MIKIDENQCIGCGLCASLCDEVFQMKDNGKAMVKAQKKKPCVKDAIDSCPVTAISE